MEKIDARVIRERVLIFITLLAVIFLLWDFLLQGRIDSERKALEVETQKVTAEQTTLEARIAELTLALTSDPAIIKSTEITDLNRRIVEAEALLSGLSQGLISANQLPEALEDVLQKTSSVNVLQVRTLPASELHLEKKEPPAPATDVAVVD
ncbi:MAG TPA: MSHA biogenesis protein MshJ, partial [Cellvibrio sp.]